MDRAGKQYPHRVWPTVIINGIFHFLMMHTHSKVGLHRRKRHAFDYLYPENSTADR